MYYYIVTFICEFELKDAYSVNENAFYSKTFTLLNFDSWQQLLDIYFIEKLNNNIEQQTPAEYSYADCAWY